MTAESGFEPFDRWMIFPAGTSVTSKHANSISIALPLSAQVARSLVDSQLREAGFTLSRTQDVEGNEGFFYAKDDERIMGVVVGHGDEAADCELAMWLLSLSPGTSDLILGDR